jgi:hypothetical protein
VGADDHVACGGRDAALGDGQPGVGPGEVVGCGDGDCARDVGFGFAVYDCVLGMALAHGVGDGRGCIGC